MGVKTKITLKEINTLFPTYNFTQLTPTKNGIIDTTYIIKNSLSVYVLKKYERDISQKIENDKAILNLLSMHNLNISTFLEEKNGWYLYTKLKGKTPKTIQLYHIHSLARFMAKFHNLSKKVKNTPSFLQHYEPKKMLASIKQSHYYYYKKFSLLTTLKQKHDGFIHGDIFKDNTLFDKKKIAVFDFIDGGLGEFSFDIAVALLSFNPKNKSLHVNTFLRCYNQYSRKKITHNELQKQLKTAAKFYALLRINHDKNTKRLKELASFY